MQNPEWEIYYVNRTSGPCVKQSKNVILYFKDQKQLNNNTVINAYIFYGQNKRNINALFVNGTKLYNG